MKNHIIRISEKTYNELLGFKQRWSLSYNDIIAKGLEALKEIETGQKQKTSVDVDTKVYKIQVSLNRVHINPNVEKLLEAGYDLFIPDITPRQAMYIKRKFKNMGYDMQCSKSEGDGKKGFLFVHC